MTETEKDQAGPVAPMSPTTAGTGPSEPAVSDTVSIGHFRLTLTSIAFCLCVLMVGFDNTIISTAIPRITDDFKAIDDVGWYASGYLLTTCAFQLLYGRLYTIFNIKWAFVAALVIFEIGSLLCAVAPTSTALIVGRAIAGVGAAGLFSGALTIIAILVPLRSRPLYIGVVASMLVIASVLGPILGGVFTDRLTWRWCFYINLPIGAVAVAIVCFALPSLAQADTSIPLRTRLAKLDYAGTITFIPAVICIMIALQWGGLKYAWSNWRIIVLFVVSGCLAIAFALIQIKQGENATVPPRLIRQRAIWSATAFAACIGGSLFSALYFVAIWFQAIQGISATDSGVKTLPLFVAQVVVAFIAGLLTTLTGYYTPYFYVGAIFSAVGAGLMTTWNVDTSNAKLIGYQILLGAGPGFGIQQSIIAVQANSKPADTPITTALAMFGLNFGGTIFITVAESVFINGLFSRIVVLFPGLTKDQVLSNGVTTFSNVAASLSPDLYAKLLQAYNDALTTGPFAVACALGGAALLPALWHPWTNVKGMNMAAAMA